MGGRRCKGMKLHHHRKNASEFPGALSPGKGVFWPLLKFGGRRKSQVMHGNVQRKHFSGPPAGGEAFLRGGQEQGQSSGRDGLFRVTSLPRVWKSLRPLLRDVHPGLCHGNGSLRDGGHQPFPRAQSAPTSQASCVWSLDPLSSPSRALWGQR